jgi:hypothetical protein
MAFPLFLPEFFDASEIHAVAATDSIEYDELDKIVHKLFVRLKAKMGWHDASFIKYRLSANRKLIDSNSTDAAFLHRDIVHIQNDPLEVYTLVCYADSAKLRFVQGSENCLDMPLAKFIKAPVSHQEFKGGDAFLFDGHMLHAACDLRSSKRRVLQIFGICPNSNDCDKIISLRGGHINASVERMLSYAMVLCATNCLIRWFSELTAAKNYYTSSLNLSLRFNCISPEAAIPRIEKNKKYQPFNLYVPVNVNDTDAATERYLRWVLQMRCYLISSTPLACAACATLGFFLAF